jgi:hypothetical protein
MRLKKKMEVYRMTQTIGKTYAQLIKFGRLLENHEKANEVTDERPDIIFAFVESVDRQLLWTSTDDFFSVFPPVKRYVDDGSWDYKSTLDMRQERLGTHFGKDDFKHLIMNSCYENKHLRLVGVSFMWAISRIHKKRTGGSLLDEFLSRETH